MEHPFFPMTTTRAEALRWLTIAEKLLSARDLMGSKSFATRAHDADPTLSPADQILAVADTLLAGDMRIGNNLQDLYAILRLTPQQGRDAELIDRQYRSLALILNPQKNNFPFAEQAFALVLEAWSVLSNPSRKLMYDKELAFYLQPQPQPQPTPPPPQQQQTDLFGNPIPVMHHNIFAGVSSSSGVSYHSQPQGVTYPSPPPPQPQSTVHFSQVHVHSNSPVEPVVGESVRVPPNLMNFSSAPTSAPAPAPAHAPNIVFGTGLGSKPGIESLNKQPQETTYPHFQGNVVAAAPPGTSQAQMSNNQEQPQQNYSNVGDGSGHTHNVNVNENVEEEEPIEEEEEDMERMEPEAEEEEAEEEMDAPTDEVDSPFWTACPYCYYMYEYPRVYVDCTLRCSNCKMAFQAVVIPSPPPIVDGQEGYFCCWGFLPMGFSMEHWEKNKVAASTWTPFSPMFSCPQGWGNNPKRQPGLRKTEPRIYVDDDEVFLEFSDSSESDDDWNTERRKKKKRASNPRGRGASGTPNRASKRGQTDKGKNVEVQDGFVPLEGVETTTPNKTAASDAGSKGPAVVTARKQPARAAKNFGKLDLNVECSNEAEEVVPRVNEENGPGHGHGHGGDDNIEGIGFFEGLDEFLSSLPILNVVGEEKVVKAA